MTYSNKAKKFFMTLIICLTIMFLSALMCALVMNLNHSEVNIRRYDVYKEKFVDFEIQELYDLNSGKTYIIYDGQNGCSLLEIVDSDGNSLPMKDGILYEKED